MIRFHTAVFKPYRESIRGSLSLGPASPIVRGLAKLLGIRLSDIPSTGTGVALRRSLQLEHRPVSSPGSPLPARSASSRARWVFPRDKGGSGAHVQRTTHATADGTAWSRSIRLPIACHTSWTSCSTRAACGAAKANERLARRGTGRDRCGLVVTPPQANARPNSRSTSRRSGARGGRPPTTSRATNSRAVLRHLPRDARLECDLRLPSGAPNRNFTFNFHIALRAQPDISSTGTRATIRVATRKFDAEDSA